MFKQTHAGFKSVIDFQTPRPPLPALGFYAFHVVGCVAFSSIVSGIVGLILVAAGMDYHEGPFIGITVHIAEALSEIYAVALYALIIHARDKWKDPISLLVLVATAVLTMFGGALFGIIPSGVTLGLKPRQ